MHSNITFSGCLNILVSSDHLFFWNDTLLQCGRAYTLELQTLSELHVSGSVWLFCIELQYVKSFWKECSNSLTHLDFELSVTGVDQLRTT